MGFSCNLWAFRAIYGDAVQSMGAGRNLWKSLDGWSDCAGRSERPRQPGSDGDGWCLIGSTTVPGPERSRRAGS
jgi:hypothetical protein